jgi:hypothetical protein
MTTEQIAGTADLSPYLNEPISALLPKVMQAAFETNGKSDRHQDHISA